MGEESKLYFYDVNTKVVKLFADYTNGNVVEILQDAKNAFISESFDNVEEFASLLDSAIVHCAEDDRSLLSKYYTLNILPQLERILQS